MPRSFSMEHTRSQASSVVVIVYFIHSIMILLHELPAFADHIARFLSRGLPAFADHIARFLFRGLPVIADYTTLKGV